MSAQPEHPDAADAPDSDPLDRIEPEAEGPADGPEDVERAWEESAGPADDQAPSG